MKTLLADLLKNIQTYYNDLVALLPKLGVAILVFIILYFIANRIKSIVNRTLVARMDDPLLAKFIANALKITMVIISLLIALQILGLSQVAAGIITGASVSAIVVGFAFKDIGENFLAGIILAFNRPFRVGDTVELQGQKGKVVALNLRDIQIKSQDGRDIYIPNANVIKNPVINFSLDAFLRYEFDVRLDYGADVKKAIKIIRRSLATMDDILDGDKVPNAEVSNLGEESINLKVYYWLDTFSLEISPEDIKMAAVGKVLRNLKKEGFYLHGQLKDEKVSREEEQQDEATEENQEGENFAL